MSSLDRLTPKQIQILARMLQGETPKEIAESLGNSTSTIYTNYNQILLRVGCKNIAELHAKFRKPIICKNCGETVHD